MKSTRVTSDFKFLEIGTDCDHSGLFPSPGGGKIRTEGRFLYVAYGTNRNGSVVRRFDGEQWASSPILPIQPPYIDVDTQGRLHVAGLHVEKRDEVWYFQSTGVDPLNSLSAGEVLHPKNYSSLAVDRNDDALYYFGAGVVAGGLGFMRRTADGRWSRRAPLARGQLIYPGVVIRDGVIHLMYSGWDPPAALYENVFYMKSADRGVSWSRADGTPIEVPFDYNPAFPERVAKMDRVTRCFEDGHFETNTHNQQLYIDRAGRPHILYSFVPTYFPLPGRFPRGGVVHARWEKGVWKHSLFTKDADIDVSWASITEGLSGTWHCICTFRTNGRRFFDLGYCSSHKNGETWSAIERLTDDADSKQSSYTYLHWAPNSYLGKLQFICNRSGGGPIYLGQVETSNR